MPRCKTPEVSMREAYFRYAATQRDEGNAADGRFSATCYVSVSSLIANVVPPGLESEARWLTKSMVPPYLLIIP